MSLELKCNPTIVKFQAMPNDACWQGVVLGLGDDGVLYMSEHDENGSRWSVYVENEFTPK